MKEELGVQVTDCREVYSTVFTYPHATVHLHFQHCRLNPEELKCLEGQTYRFCTLEDLPHPIFAGDGTGTSAGDGEKVVLLL